MKALSSILCRNNSATAPPVSGAISRSYVDCTKLPVSLYWRICRLLAAILACTFGITAFASAAVGISDDQGQSRIRQLQFPQIEEVIPRGTAERAGFRAGDTFIAYGGYTTAIPEPDAFCRIVALCKGRSADAIVLRQGRCVMLTAFVPQDQLLGVRFALTSLSPPSDANGTVDPKSRSTPNAKGNSGLSRTGDVRAVSNRSTDISKAASNVSGFALGFSRGAYVGDRFSRLHQSASSLNSLSDEANSPALPEAPDPDVTPAVTPLANPVEDGGTVEDIIEAVVEALF